MRVPVNNPNEAHYSGQNKHGREDGARSMNGVTESTTEPSATMIRCDLQLLNLGESLLNSLKLHN